MIGPSALEERGAGARDAGVVDANGLLSAHNPIKGDSEVTAGWTDVEESLRFFLTTSTLIGLAAVLPSEA